jgi:D-glycero-alpha-D-manno-heptose-7-phosphate kinase
VSFFGGGTDYPSYYRENPGAVLATTIDKYCYLICRELPPYFEHKYNITYSELERPQTVDEIRHPSIRETIKFVGLNCGLDVRHAGDLPARAGMGTSSSFTVGLLNALYAIKGEVFTKSKLAHDAIYIEQEMTHDNVGSQDQTLAAYGGFNRVTFNGDKITVDPVHSDYIDNLESHCMVFFTGLSRTASLIAAEQIKNTSTNSRQLRVMYETVNAGMQYLIDGNIEYFGKLLLESWKLKKSLTSLITTEYIDFLFNKAINAGAIGGKLLGAGGGGFLLFIVKPENQARVKKELNTLLHVPIKFEHLGSQIVYRGD